MGPVPTQSVGSRVSVAEDRDCGEVACGGGWGEANQESPVLQVAWRGVVVGAVVGAAADHGEAPVVGGGNVRD